MSADKLKYIIRVQAVMAIMLLLSGCHGNTGGLLDVDNTTQAEVAKSPLYDGVDNDEFDRRKALAKEIDNIINNLPPVRPDTLGTVKLGPYKGIELETVERTLVSSQDVENYIHNALAGYRIEQATAETGDYVNIDFMGVRDEDGVAFEGGTVADYEVRLGSDTLIEEFEKRLIGAGKGEMVTIRMTMPEDSRLPDIAGKEVTFHVKVNSIMREPELTESLIISLTGGRQTNIKDYKSAVAEKIQKEYDYRNRTVLYYNAAAKVMAQSEFYAKEEAIDWEMDHYMINYNKMFNSGTHDMSLSMMIALSGHTYEEFRDTLRNLCLQSLHKKILLNAIADRERIVVTKKDIKDYMEISGMTLDDMDALGYDEVEDRVRQDLAAQFIVDHAMMVSS